MPRDFGRHGEHFGRKLYVTIVVFLALFRDIFSQTAILPDFT